MEMSSVFEKIETAKRMTVDRDYTGARSKLLEAHYQFPGYKIVPQMITACDILCASELTLDGETDWYWVLQLSPEASNSQIRLKYNKLAALLEGIKDDFPGSDTALKLVHDAYVVLSNTSKTWVFNSRRLTSKDVCESFVPTVSSPRDMGHHSSKSLSQKHGSSVVCQSSLCKDASTTEGLLDVDERNLIPIEIDDSDDADDNQQNEGIRSTELNFISSSLKLEVTQTTDKNVATTMDDLSNEKSLRNLKATTSLMSVEDIINFDGTKKAEAFEVGQIWAAYDSEMLPRRYARINDVSESPFSLDVTWLRPRPQNENERKWCEVGLSVVCGLFNLHENEESLVDSSIFSHVVSCTTSPTYDEFEIFPQEDEVWAVYKDWRPFDWLENPESKRGCSLRIVRILEGYSEQEGMLVVPLVRVDGSHNIYKRETEISRECSVKIPADFLYRFSHQLPACDLEGGKWIGVFGDMPPQDPLASSSSISQRPVSCPSSVDSLGNSLKVEWTAINFAASQVWAIYDGSDQMPRQYAVVNKVFPTGAVEVTFLEPHPNPMDNEEICWIEENLPVGCGIFKLGSRIAILPFSKFSHFVVCDRTTKNMFFRIYPKRGEIWAMYRNWNKKWKQQNFVKYHCRIVEITSDFTEPSGLHTSSLEEVPGYKTFFQKQLCDGFALNQVVPRSDMLSFSHRIEAYVVPGIEAHGIPDCSWHLEPDALPPLLSNA